jgi:hypothetical protein
MSNKTVTYTTKRGDKVTINADSVVNHRALWTPSYHLADLILAELGIDSSKTKIRNKFVGNIKASMSALHNGAVTAGEVEAYKKIKKIPANLKALIQLDKFNYAFKADGVDITKYPMFLQVDNTTKKTTKKTTAKHKVAAAKVLKPNGFGNKPASVKITAVDNERDAKLDAFLDMASELGIDLKALLNS